MNTSRITHALAAVALTIALVPAAHGEEKKQDRRVVVVKNGHVFTTDGSGFSRLRPRGFLGVTTIDLTPELREHFRVQKDAGVLVSKVVADSPAAKAGIQVGDIITAIDGSAVESPGSLARAMRDKKKGDTLRIDYNRNGANATAVATAVEREMKVVDLSDFDIQIPDIQTPDVGKHMERFFNSPEWKDKLNRLQELPDCAEMQQRILQLESKMKDLERRLGQK